MLAAMSATRVQGMLMSWWLSLHMPTAPPLMHWLRMQCRALAQQLFPLILLRALMHWSM
jgi:hypothetical protein